MGEDIVVRYEGGDRFFPARVITDHPADDRLDVIFFEGRTCEQVHTRGRVRRHQQALEDLQADTLQALWEST